jgi:hypothetical protein
MQSEEQVFGDRIVNAAEAAEVETVASLDAKTKTMPRLILPQASVSDKRSYGAVVDHLVATSGKTPLN